MLAKKGEGLRQIIEACGGAQQAFQLLMLEHFDHLVEASAKAISNIKFDKVVVWEGGAANGQSATANWMHNMARSLPPMMQVLKRHRRRGASRDLGQIHRLAAGINRRIQAARGNRRRRQRQRWKITRTNHRQ